MAKDTAAAVLRYEVRTGRLDGGWVEALAAFVDDPGATTAHRPPAEVG